MGERAGRKGGRKGGAVNGLWELRGSIWMNCIRMDCGDGGEVCLLLVYNE